MLHIPKVCDFKAYNSSPHKEKTASKRGRPKTRNESQTQKGSFTRRMKLALQGTAHRAVYLSTTKGGMKILFEGHHFKYMFRRNECSIFQCCYNENNDQCQVRIIAHRNCVYAFEGEHIHYSQATDKSVTSLMFEADPYDFQITSVETLKNAKIAISKEAEIDKFVEEVITLSDSMHDLDDIESVKDITLSAVHKKSTTVDNIREISATKDANIGATSTAADDFREQIKKRLQKALTGKRK